MPFPGSGNGSKIWHCPSAMMSASDYVALQGGGAGAAEGQGAAGSSFDEYYQGRMSLDRIGDSLARILVAAAIFTYAGYRVRELEGKEI